MTKLPDDEILIPTLADFWEQYSFELLPPTIRYSGWKSPKVNTLSIITDQSHSRSLTSLRVGGVDWGRAPDSLHTACHIVQTAAIMLLDATREPEAYLLAFEFAGEILSRQSDHWTVSAKFVRDWYRAEIEAIAEDAVADYVVEVSR